MNLGLKVDLNNLRKNFDKADFKHGKSSYCFIIGEYIVKVYARKKDGVYPENVCNFSKYEANTIVYPLMYIKDKGVIAAEVSKVINSKDITESFNDDASLDVISNSFDIVVNDLYTYSDIRMNDLCSANILFSNELGFHIIDTTEWEEKTGSLNYNLRRLNMALISVFKDNLEIPIIYSLYYNKIDDNFYQNMTQFGNPGKRLQESMDLIMNDRFNFLKLLYALIDVYRVYSGNDPKSLGDVKKIVKVLRNS